MGFLIGDLPRDMREELFNNHAMFTNLDATEKTFFATHVPLGELDLSLIDESPPGSDSPGATC